ncbi:MAG: DUF1772 domain-containing protein [Acidimicrobiia bacterium]
MAQSAYDWLGLALLLNLAMMSGVFLLYGHTILPGLRKLPDRPFVEAFRTIDRAIINPLFMLQFLAPVPMLVSTYWHARSEQLPEASQLLGATLTYTVAVVLTIAVNVPLNDHIKDTPDDLTAETSSKAREGFRERRWAASNHIRTVCTLTATLLVAGALLQRLG